MQSNTNDLFNDFLENIGCFHTTVLKHKNKHGVSQNFKCPIITNLDCSDPGTFIVRYRSSHYLRAALQVYKILRYHSLGQLCLGLVQYGVHKKMYFASYSTNLVDGAIPANAHEIANRASDCRLRERELEKIWPTLPGMSFTRPEFIFFTNLETQRVFPIFGKLRCSARAKNALIQ